jgi:hypothetical protein
MDQSEKTRGLMRIAIIVALIAGSYALVVFANSFKQTIDPASTRNFSVSGEGRIIAEPDIATFSYTVISEGDTDLASLRSDNATRSNSVNAFLKEQGVLPADIKTTGLDVSPRYEQCYAYREPGGVCPPPTIVGYTITQSTAVKVRDFDSLGTILGGVVDSGANQLSQLNFTIDDPTEIENEARAEAIASAQEKARSMARAGGFTVGRLLSISEGYVGQPYMAYSKVMYAEDAMGMGAPAPAIEAGSQEVTANISLTYEIR